MNDARTQRRTDERHSESRMRGNRTYGSMRGRREGRGRYASIKPRKGKPGHGSISKPELFWTVSLLYWRLRGTGPRR